MKTRNSVRIISYTCALILVLGTLAVTNMAYSKSYQASLENNYQQSLNELAESLDSIQTNLTKSIYSNSDNMILEISSQLFAECTQAKEALSRLPVTQMQLGSTYKFISQASDYSNYIAQKIADGETITSEEHNNLKTLLGYAEQLSDSVEAMVAVCNNGGKITTSQVKSTDNISVSTLIDNMTSDETTFKDYPTLLYDGPFADAVLNKDAKYIEGCETYSQEEARDAAAYALNCNVSEVSYETDEESTIPCYVFSYGQRTVAITKQGGFVCYILYGGKITTSSIDESNAINIAKKYLDKLGYSNMSSTYYMINNNICVINFAYKQSGITYYSDLIKVGVSMDTGKVVSFEAKGFLTNHEDRDIDTSKKYDSNEISKNISSYLTIQDSKKCLIPKDDGTEVLCYEYHCKAKDTGDEVLVYINCETKEEEDIMLLLYSDGGTLTK